MYILNKITLFCVLLLLQAPLCATRSKSRLKWAEEQKKVLLHKPLARQERYKVDPLKILINTTRQAQKANAKTQQDCDILRQEIAQLEAENKLLNSINILSI